MSNVPDISTLNTPAIGALAAIEQLKLPSTIELLLKATQPISHHDPAAVGKSNTSVFNRQKQLVRLPAVRQQLTQAEIDDVCRREPVPEGELVYIMQDMDFFEFVACAVVRRFLDCYNAGDGTGLLSGMERYNRLESRTEQAAIRSHSLREFWNNLARRMQVEPKKKYTKSTAIGTEREDGDIALMSLLSIAKSAQQVVLRKLAFETQSVNAIARAWHTKRKEQNARYVAKQLGLSNEEIETMDEEGELAVLTAQASSVALSWSVSDCTTPDTAVEVMDVPAIQGNTLRHQIIRGPLWAHLCRTLGIEQAGVPGQSILPPGVEALFVNGGNIAPGAKAPGNTHLHAQMIRAHFPSLDLLGGNADAFDLGESRLSVGCTLVCRENKDELPEWARKSGKAEVSAFSLLDDVAQTRQASPQGVGQFIYGCEVLAEKTEIVVHLTLQAFTPPLAQSALLTAITEFMRHPFIGGQKRNRFGNCEVEIKAIGLNPAVAGLYERYLIDNRDFLVAEMMNGTMGTGVKVLS